MLFLNIVLYVFKFETMLLYSEEVESVVCLYVFKFETMLLYSEEVESVVCFFFFYKVHLCI